MSATKTVEGIMEPLSATVRPDLRPAGIGGCTCAAGTMYAACTCSWSVMIDRLLMLGYGHGADAVTIAREAQGLSEYCEATLRTARVAAIHSLARQWPGSVEALARLVGLSGQRLRDLAPRVTALVKAAKQRELRKRWITN